MFPSKVRYYSVLSMALGLALFALLWDTPSGELGEVIHTLRQTRALAAFLAGAALASGGAIVQGLFQNPLASPSILGTTAGANLGGQVMLLGLQGLGWQLQPELAMPVGCLLGALLSLGLLLVLIRRTEDLLALLLTGFLLNSLFLAVGSLLMSLAQEQWQLGRAIVSFALGSLTGVGGTQVLFAGPLVAVALVAAFFWGRPLDVMLSGEREARSLGVNVKQLRRWTVIWVSVLVAAAVSLAGTLAFVGLVVPHVVRPFVGVKHRTLLPATALGGGVFVLLCDILTQRLPSPGEVPLGVVTALIGAPVFLVILLRERQQVSR